MKYQRKIREVVRCPIENGLKVFGGKWDVRIISTLETCESLRYSQLKLYISDISDTVLSKTLNKLVSSGIVRRIDFHEIPPHVEYTLTEKGSSLIPIIRSICSWSQKNCSGEAEETDLLLQCEKCIYLNPEKKQ